MQQPNSKPQQQQQQQQQRLNTHSFTTSTTSSPSTSSSTPQFNSSFYQSRNKRKQKLYQQQQQQQPQQLYPVGSEVEVSSDKEGFRGVWYLATVLIPPSRSLSSSSNSKQQLLVEFKTLYSRHNTCVLLKEFVDLAFVRPKPPPIHDNLFFQLNDVVDAFYQHGWRTGVITSLFSSSSSSPNRRYRVFFSDPPAEMQFCHSDLRLHSNWVAGKWLLPDKRRMGELNFSSGTAIEVNTDPDNLYDTWFPAALVEKVSDNSFVVEYQSSREARRVKVVVDILHIRPSPPISSSRIFTLLERVDAFVDYCWLSGIVTKILADRRYIVYFKRTKKEKELCHADLRPHLEWTNGKWVCSSKDNPLSSNSEKKSDHATNGGYKKVHSPPVSIGTVKENVGKETSSAISMSCQKVVQASGCEDANCDGKTSSNKRCKRANANDDSICLEPSNRLNEKIGSDVTLSNESCKAKMKQTEGSNDATKSDLDTTVPNNLAKSSLKQSEDSEPSASPENQGDDMEQSVIRKRGRPRKLQNPRKFRAIWPDTVNELPDKSDVVSPFDSTVIRFAHNDEMIPSVSGSLGQCMKEWPKKTLEEEVRHCDTSADHGSEVNDGGELRRESEVTYLNRKRGRLPKVLSLVGSPKTREAEFVKDSKDAVSGATDTSEGHVATDEIEKEPVTVVDPVEDGDSSPKNHIKHLNDIHQPNTKSVRKRTLRKRRKYDIHPMNTRSIARTLRRRQKVNTETIKDKVDINEPARHSRLNRGRLHRQCKKSGPLNDGISRKKGTLHRRCKKSGPPTKDVSGHSRGRVAEVLNTGVATAVETVVSRTLSGVSDDRPISSWFEGAPSPPVTEGVTAGHCDESEKKQEQEKGRDQSNVKVLETKVVNTPSSRDDNASQRPDEIQSTAIVPCYDEELPFVKNSLVWKMIESMEVFQRIPQNPHFRPLYNCKEECREGLAIGNMVTFSTLVERVSKLKFSDPKSLLDGYLDALNDLEHMGFNVVPVRDQLNTLLAIKSRHEQAWNSYKNIEDLIVVRNHEKLEIDEEIADLGKKIEELNEKRRKAVSKKEVNDSMIELLQSSVDSVKGSLDTAAEEFEEVASLLW